MCPHDYHRQIYLQLAGCEEAKGHFALAAFYRLKAAEHGCVHQTLASRSAGRTSSP
jgi:hypothetical protein